MSADSDRRTVLSIPQVRASADGRFGEARLRQLSRPSSASRVHTETTSTSQPQEYQRLSSWSYMGDTESHEGSESQRHNSNATFVEAEAARAKSADARAQLLTLMSSQRNPRDYAKRIAVQPPLQDLILDDSPEMATVPSSPPLQVAASPPVFTRVVGHSPRTQSFTAIAARAQVPPFALPPPAVSRTEATRQASKDIAAVAYSTRVGSGQGRTGPPELPTGLSLSGSGMKVPAPHVIRPASPARHIPDRPDMHSRPWRTNMAVSTTTTTGASSSSSVPRDNPSTASVTPPTAASVTTVSVTVATVSTEESPPAPTVAGTVVPSATSHSTAAVFEAVRDSAHSLSGSPITPVLARLVSSNSTPAMPSQVLRALSPRQRPPTLQLPRSSPPVPTSPVLDAVKESSTPSTPRSGSPTPPGGPTSLLATSPRFGLNSPRQRTSLSHDTIVDSYEAFIRSTQVVVEQQQQQKQQEAEALAKSAAKPPAAVKPKKKKGKRRVVKKIPPPVPSTAPGVSFGKPPAPVKPPKKKKTVKKKKAPSTSATGAILPTAPPVGPPRSSLSVRPLLTGSAVPAVKGKKGKVAKKKTT